MYKMRIIYILTFSFLLLFNNINAQTVKGAKNGIAFQEKDKFGGWPANNGLWTWDNGKEILVGYTYGPFVEQQGHNIEGKPVDIAPWAYAWRADRVVQEKPEAYFIPRRLERLDKVYRTAYAALPPDQLKSIYYQQLDLVNPLLPAPKGRLLAGLLWTGGLADYRVELRWPAGAAAIPAPDAVEVRVYPTSFGWFGWTVDKILGKPAISADGLTWTYKPEPGATMDWAYNVRVAAATEMVAVFCESAGSATPPVPDISVVGPDSVVWRRMDLEIEWGFQKETVGTDVDGRIEASVALLGPLASLDKGTTITGDQAWRSRGGKAGRRGVSLSVLYASGIRPGLDSRITLWTSAGGTTIRLTDLDNGPVLIPRAGLFVTRAGSQQTARAFEKALAARKLKTARQMIREHREAVSWEEAFREVRLWRCPKDTPVPAFPAVPDPVMQVDVPDPRWVGMWGTATEQLRGKHMWGNLAAEVAPVAHAMEMTGLHAEAAKIYDYFLASPGVKSDGDFSDPSGSLEWAKHMRHDMGYSHEGTHCSTGRLLLSMTERYFLTGDKEWFLRHRVRLQAAADWIIRERRNYMQGIPNREALHVAGLLPPSMVGDYALPACDWHWYYYDNAFAVQGLSRFADALMEIDPAAGRKYREEAEAFRVDVRAAVDRDAALAPVRLARDGTYRSYIPMKAYARGLMLSELGAPQHNGGRPWDLMLGALPLASRYSVLKPDDPRVMDTLDALEESNASTRELFDALGIAYPSAKSLEEIEALRREKGLPTDDTGFWTVCINLPKWSFNSDVYLLQDEVPAFLRFWINESVSMVGANGKLWEHWRPDSYDSCDNPDNGTSGWFITNFRNLLVLEFEGALWLARGVPRAWLEQGKRIGVKNAPTYYGPLAYEIVSDVDHGKITATIDVPSRTAPASMLLRLRHPQAKPMRSVTVNGEKWKAFDKEKETIELKGLTGKVTVEASY